MAPSEPETETTSSLDEIRIDFEEPRLAEDRCHMASGARQLASATSRPYSAAFKRLKP